MSVDMVASLTAEEVLKRIEIAKAKLGGDLIILAHFYQHDDIIRYADFVGDSLQLARTASKRQDVKYIVFCAVSFMAEMARILCLPEQQVFHPEPQARCPLAEMAAVGEVEAAWAMLKKTGGKIVPVVYVNSRADLKAFCGRNEGFVCTSSNAKKAMEYVFSQDAIPFFFPDENLGKNTAHSMGINDEEMFLWEPNEVPSEKDIKKVRDTKVILWKGFCYVHVAFQASHVEALRKAYGNDMKIIVHPECIPEVVRLSDYVGSTSFIQDTVAKAPSGSQWAIGTEIHFVDRIRRDNPDKLILPLRDWACREMAKVTPMKLLAVLEGLVDGKPLSGVTVDSETAEYARVALDRMLEIS
jgi:quinolinate synthase